MALWKEPPVEREETKGYICAGTRQFHLSGLCPLDHDHVPAVRIKTVTYRTRLENPADLDRL